MSPRSIRSSPELKQAFEEHLQKTEEHVDRLERVFEQLGLSTRGAKCAGMKALISEGEDMIGEAENPSTRDAVMIAAAQKVEHYEIATYGTLRTWATRTGHTDAANLLEETLDDEKEADRKLTEIAESAVNLEAAEQGQKGEEGAEARGTAGRLSPSARRPQNGRSRQASGRSVAADRSRRALAARYDCAEGRRSTR